MSHTRECLSVVCYLSLVPPPRMHTPLSLTLTISVPGSFSLSLSLSHYRALSRSRGHMELLLLSSSLRRARPAEERRPGISFPPHPGTSPLRDGWPDVLLSSSVGPGGPYWVLGSFLGIYKEAPSAALGLFFFWASILLCVLLLLLFYILLYRDSYIKTSPSRNPFISTRISASNVGN